MHRLELVWLINERNGVNDLLNTAKKCFERDKTLESFNTMRDLQKRYQSLNDQIYTYEGIMFYYKLLNDPTDFNSQWTDETGFNDFKDFKDVIFYIGYIDPEQNDIQIITLNKSTTGLPTFKSKIYNGPSDYYLDEMASMDHYTDERDLF